MKHPWNLRVIQILEKDFLEYLKAKQLAELVELLGNTAMSIDDDNMAQALDKITNIRSAIEDKLSAYRSVVLSRLRAVEKMKLKHEPPSEINEMLSRKTELAKVRNRRVGRQKLVYDSMLHIFPSILANVLFLYH